ncbi:Acyl dehydratase [Cupriavidus necator]|uniref:Acyl dehydratase n=1 Tax=Cupriavidus necator (strain ATCC 17699 / DSM 428 / KCTC 22496 / NCIMB 10442 / H16 / Stanier 337) TaxID=381666 RepID=Q0K460_CUPNH|nr:MaoC/PaaZ C-terminal domain-containing protein [Cupriavidus necator]QCC03136.1 acyl dehydratase [Cupriavidus necator H16]QQB80193.1 MaoC family dehydratase N-terminal domain-containing protein [Cupriavidus necator]WKA44458.1 MaoC/PaaZ C-terminal domain-containing protein [Cupriavidus necator]CAJ95214.1 acyl dehydratase [Cupriavidus necator H16]
MTTQPLLTFESLQRLSLCWDDLTVGTKYTTSSRTITEADVAAFAALTGDMNRLHVDAEYAGTSVHGQRIAHGMLVASFMAGLTSRAIPNQLMEDALFGVLENRIRFPRATHIGDTIRVEVEVVEQRPTSKPERGLTGFLRKAVNQRGEVCAEMETTYLMRRRRTSHPGS